MASIASNPHCPHSHGGSSRSSSRQSMKPAISGSSRQSKASSHTGTPQSSDTQPRLKRVVESLPFSEIEVLAEDNYYHDDRKEQESTSSPHASDRSLSSNEAVRGHPSFSSSVSTLSYHREILQKIHYTHSRPECPDDERYTGSYNGERSGSHISPEDERYTEPSDMARTRHSIRRYRAEDLGFDTSYVGGSRSVGGSRRSRSYDDDIRRQPDARPRYYHNEDDDYHRYARHHVDQRGYRSTDYSARRPRHDHGVYRRTVSAEDYDHHRDHHREYRRDHNDLQELENQFLYHNDLQELENRFLSAMPPLPTVDQAISPLSRPYTNEEPLALPRSSVHTTRTRNDAAPDRIAPTSQHMIMDRRNESQLNETPLPRTPDHLKLAYARASPPKTPRDFVVPMKSRPGAHHMAGPPPGVGVQNQGIYRDDDHRPHSHLDGNQWDDWHHHQRGTSSDDDWDKKMPAKPSLASSSSTASSNKTPHFRLSPSTLETNQISYLKLPPPVPAKVPKGMYSVCPTTTTTQQPQSTQQKHQNKDKIFVEIFSGVKEQLRRTDETQKAVARDFFTPVSCKSCDQYLFCIADLSYFACPKCECISALEQADGDRFEGRPIQRHGLGVGFTVETLFRMQSELADYSPSSSSSELSSSAQS